MTKVLFLIEKPEGNLPCNVFAFFPTKHWYQMRHPEYKKMFTSYSHIGQHSASHIDYVKGCEWATADQYSDLLAELKQAGYDDLKVLNNQ